MAEAQDAPKWRGIVQLAVVVAVVLAAILLATAPQQEFLELDSDTARRSVELTAATAGQCLPASGRTSTPSAA
ncbi:MAG: hypothetical protein OXI55_16270 [Gammaproteobacteria bacterium]|nr:hypothetical protein [Gammaproteobacteria bacterium]